MTNLVKFEQFVEDDAHGVHRLGVDELYIYLTNVTPDVVNDKIKANLPEIPAGGGYSGPVAVTRISSGQTNGIYKYLCNDFIPYATAVGGTIGPFRYAVLYNDTPTSPNKPLIAYWDRGSDVTLYEGDSFDLVFQDALLELT